MIQIDGVEGARALVGQTLGAGSWLEINQDRVNKFAELTGDHQWIHVDIERAAKSPFGGTIAHGYLLLSLIPYMTRDIFSFENVPARLNYGLDRVRFISPVRVGSRIRLHIEMKAVSFEAKGARVTMAATMELEGQDKPAFVADLIILLVS
jgi:acyl dehydratase